MPRAVCQCARHACHVPVPRAVPVRCATAPPSAGVAERKLALGTGHSCRRTGTRHVARGTGTGSRRVFDTSGLKSRPAPGARATLLRLRVIQFVFGLGLIVLMLAVETLGSWSE